MVLRKAYGLGAQAMAGGTSRTPLFTVAWPTGEFGGMGLEGPVKLGYRNELAAIEDPEERRQKYEEHGGARLRERQGAQPARPCSRVDDMIDPAETRYLGGEHAEGRSSRVPRQGKKRAFVDGW